MNPSSRRRRREELNQQKVAWRQAARKLRQRQAAQGLTSLPTRTITNGKSEWTTVDEEKQARHEAVAEQIKV